MNTSVKRAGKFGTLYLYRVSYIDTLAREDGTMVSSHWGYDAEHAEERFYGSVYGDGDFRADGTCVFEVTKVERARER